MTVDGNVYRKIGEFPIVNERQTGIFSYTVFRIDDDGIAYSLSSLSRTEDYKYYYWTNWCCDEKNIYLLVSAATSDRFKKIAFMAAHFGITQKHFDHINNFPSLSFSSLMINKSATLGDLSWAYDAVADNLIFVRDKHFVVGILFGVEEDRGALTYKYYDFSTSSLYGISAGIRNWFDKTRMATAMGLTNTQLNLRSPNGTAYKITVSNDGELTATKSSS